MSTSSTTLHPSVSGYENRKNDLILSGNLDSSHAVVFFGGDIQDLELVMTTQSPTTCKFAHWSLERTATFLTAKFPDHFIIVVRPSRKQDRVFSCFDNFVPCTNEISPAQYTGNHHALQHLDALLENLHKSLLDDVTLVGFSKGCAVLNQFLYEFNTWLSVSDNREIPRLIGKIRSMYWLDSGHWGTPEYWITKVELLRRLQQLRINVHVVTSPYQAGNVQRPCYLPELNTFLRICSEFGVLKSAKTVHEEKTFTETTIEDHFDTLKLM